MVPALRDLRLLALLALVISSLYSASAAFADPAPTEPAAETIGRLRDRAQQVIQSNFDPAATVRAERFLELTDRRPWGYHADDGTMMTFTGAYDSEVVRGNKPVLMFQSRQYVPLALLDAQGTADLAELDRIRTSLRQDFQRLQAEIAAKQAAAAEAARQAELEREAEMRRRMRRQVRILADTDLEIVDGGRPQVLNLGAGEVLELVAESPTEYVIKVGGRLVQLDRRRAEEIETTTVLKPIMPDVAAGLQPPKLDCRIGSYQFPDGTAALSIETVAVGGLGERFGLQVGDVIERVNDFAVATLDDYRLASTRNGGGLKLSLYNPAVQQRRVLTIPPPNSPVPLGIMGKIDLSGEFWIEDAVEGSIAAQLGLKRNDKLLRVNDRPILSEQDLQQAEATSGGVFRIRAVVDGQSKTLVYP